MKVVTRFGEIEIDEKSCIDIQDGLVGLPQAKRFCLISHREESPFHWLQCLDEPGLAMAVVCPTDFFKDYSFDLQDGDVEKLGLKKAEDAIVLTTVTVNKENSTVTTNLLGPIIVNKVTMTGRQVVLSSESYSTKHLLFELRPAKSVVMEEETAQAA